MEISIVETPNEAEVVLDGTLESAVSAVIEQPEEATEEQTEEAIESEEATEGEEEQSEPEESDDDEEESEESDDEQMEDSEDDEAEEEADSAQEQSTFTVKVDGKNEVVTLDELKQSYSGQKYIQKGMQENANVKKQAEAIYGALLQERQAIAQLYEQARSGNIPQPPKEPDRKLFETDPIGYMNAKLEYDDKVQDYSKEMQKLELVAQQQSEAQRVAQQTYLQHEMESLKKAVPELSDAKNVKTVRENVIRAGSEVYGFTAEEISGIVDHRALRVLMDATKYRAIVDGQEKAKQRAKPNRKRSIKAGSNKQGAKSVKRKKQQQTFKKTGSIEDAIALMIK
jgi:hypothetical protein